MSQGCRVNKETIDKQMLTGSGFTSDKKKEKKLTGHEMIQEKNKQKQKKPPEHPD